MNCFESNTFDKLTLQSMSQKLHTGWLKLNINIFYYTWVQYFVIIAKKRNSLQGKLIKKKKRLLRFNLNQYGWPDWQSIQNYILQTAKLHLSLLELLNLYIYKLKSQAICNFCLFKKTIHGQWFIYQDFFLSINWNELMWPFAINIWTTLDYCMLITGYRP